MKTTPWTFHNVTMMMLEDDAGELFCTSQQLCEALGIEENTLRMAVHNHPRSFSANCVKNFDANYIREHKAELGMKYVRGDMRLWTEHDMIAFAMYSNSEVSYEFGEELIRFVKLNARRGWVKRDEFNALAAKVDGVVAENCKLRELFAVAMPAFNNQASNAGSVLANHRVLKGLGDN